MKGKLYLIPTILSPEAAHVIPAYVHDLTNALRHFFVENEKTARRYLRSTGFKTPFEEVIMLPLNEHTDPSAYNMFLDYLAAGKDCGILSEAGVPAVADPGAEFIKICHVHGIRVVPLCGPSSVILALMASGFNGQQFCFNGYLPVKQPQRNEKIRQLEAKAGKGETQIFIETPYRNNAMIQEVLQVCQPDTWFCIASDITGEKESIQTKKIADWKKSIPQPGKIPAIFLIG